MIEAAILECEVLRRDRPTWEARIGPLVNQLRLGVTSDDHATLLGDVITLFLEAGAEWPDRPPVPLDAIAWMMAELDGADEAGTTLDRILEAAAARVPAEDPGLSRLRSVRESLRSRTG